MPIGAEFVDVRRWRGPHFLGAAGRPFVEQCNGTDNTESRYRLRGGRRFCYVASLGPSALVFPLVHYLGIAHFLQKRSALGGRRVGFVVFPEI